MSQHETNLSYFQASYMWIDDDVFEEQQFAIKNKNTNEEAKNKTFLWHDIDLRFHPLLGRRSSKVFYLFIFPLTIIFLILQISPCQNNVDLQQISKSPTDASIPPLRFSPNASMQANVSVVKESSQTKFPSQMTRKIQSIWSNRQDRMVTCAYMLICSLCIALIVVPLALLFGLPQKHTITVVSTTTTTSTTTTSTTTTTTSTTTSTTTTSTTTTTTSTTTTSTTTTTTSTTTTSTTTTTTSTTTTSTTTTTTSTTTTSTTTTSTTTTTTSTTTTSTTTTTTSTTTTTTTTTPTMVQITQPGDPIVGLYGTQQGGSTGGSNGNYPNPSQTPVQGIDGIVNTKYVNFGLNGSISIFSPQPGVNTGFYVTPNISSHSIACALLFATGNDYPERDPLEVTLEGTNAAGGGALDSGSSWTLIYNGPTGIDPVNVPGRLQYGTQQNFSNTVAYSSYRLLVTLQRNASNCVQYAEVQIIGYI